ncbi:MAG: carbohydrate ABC transporter permease [Lachnospiraceae bacterium]|nr:carbohydrate ABC transporter permease [Lachnospiraceae bacterium]
MKTTGDKRLNLIGYIVMIILTFNALIPIILMVISSLTDNASLMLNGYSFVPDKWSTYAYRWIFAFSGGMVMRAYGISFLVTIIGTLANVLITIGLAYGLSKRDLPGKSFFTFYVVFTMLFNGGLVPTYINYTNVFHIKDTIWALLVPSLLCNAFNVLLTKSYFVSGIPNEIIEAAYIDGANELQTLHSVVIPLAKPIIATISMFAGIAYWNDWNNGYIYLVKRTEFFSIQNLLNRLMQNINALTQNANQVNNVTTALADVPSVTVRMAIATLGILPIIIVYPFIEKSFVKGITLGGVKG